MKEPGNEVGLVTPDVTRLTYQSETRQAAKLQCSASRIRGKFRFWGKSIHCIIYSLGLSEDLYDQIIDPRGGTMALRLVATDCFWQIRRLLKHGSRASHQTELRSAALFVSVLVTKGHNYFRYNYAPWFFFRFSLSPGLGQSVRRPIVR